MEQKITKREVRSWFRPTFKTLELDISKPKARRPFMKNLSKQADIAKIKAGKREIHKYREKLDKIIRPLNP